MKLLSKKQGRDRGLARASWWSRRRHGGLMDASHLNTFLIDMDGVLLHGDVPIPGADAFIARLLQRQAKFLVLTNNSLYTQRDLQSRLHRVGLSIPEQAIYTSAMATAQFLHDQQPDGTAFVLGESGLTTALHDIGYTLVDTDPQYVVIGETHSYSFERITRAVRLIAAGARFIATNRDTAGPSATGLVPATGAVAALISSATGRSPYFVGKPNPLMMRTALRRVDGHSESSVMIGDNMDTDIIAGVESGMETILVLTGVSTRQSVDRYPYRPAHIVESVAEIMP
jgi:NagD protein